MQRYLKLIDKAYESGAALGSTGKEPHSPVARCLFTYCLCRALASLEHSLKPFHSCGLLLSFQLKHCNYGKKESLPSYWVVGQPEEARFPWKQMVSYRHKEKVFRTQCLTPSSPSHLIKAVIEARCCVTDKRKECWAGKESFTHRWEALANYCTIGALILYL